MSDVQARLQVRYASFTLDVDLQLPGRGVSALYGPSGCGKTTCLRAIAGLERAARGVVQVQGETWQDTARDVFRATHQRSIGYVFQEASLFAHLDVAGNLHYGMSRVAPAARRVSLDDAVDLLGIGALMQRRPDTLSGGERQRVGIARALATSPRLLLLDEPLAALDAQRKAELMPWLQRLQRELDIPMLLVSHAPDEVARLSQHLVLMDQGRVLASGPTHALLTRGDLPLAHGDAAAAVIDATVIEHDTHDALARLAFDGGTLQVTHGPVAPGTPVRLRVQARDVSLCLVPPEGSSILNVLPARVYSLQDDGPGLVMVVLDVGATRLLSQVTHKSARLLKLAPGQALHAQIKGVAILD